MSMDIKHRERTENPKHDCSIPLVITKFLLFIQSSFFLSFIHFVVILTVCTFIDYIVLYGTYGTYLRKFANKEKEIKTTKQSISQSMQYAVLKTSVY